MKRRDTLVVFVVALAARLAISIWGFSKFPAIADGEFYHRFAARLASGAGYTVAWPDGTVTYAAHYPVGYPALLAIAYAIFGASPGVAMIVNSMIGALGVGAAHRVALRELSPRVSLFAALAIAIHPTLVFYTPAVMTEVVAASLVMCALACAPHSSKNTDKTASKYVQYARIATMGIVFGIATLVRPQVLLFAPLLAFVSIRSSIRTRVVVAMTTLAVLLATVSPWTVRNCVRMNRCALVSMNGGWNLLIGSQTENGSWTELKSPDACKEVWDEAEKDACFEHAARADILENPRAFLARVPKKLAVTFDAFLAGPWYLHASNPRAFDDRDAWISGTIDLLFSRFVLLAALAMSAPLFRIRAREKQIASTIPRVALAFVGAAFAVSRTAWPAYVILAMLSIVRTRDEAPSRVRASNAIVLAATIATHAIFFGAGRYGVLVVPFVTLAAFARVRAASSLLKSEHDEELDENATKQPRGDTFDTV